MDQDLQVNLHLPANLGDHNLLIRADKPKAKPDRTQTFRSFVLPASQSGISVDSKDWTKTIEIDCVFTFLQGHGLSSLLPVHVTLGPTRMTAFDWTPHGASMPTAWPFKWKGEIPCSLTGNTGYHGRICLRVHDMTPGVGERVLDELGQALLALWTPPPEAEHAITVYTTKRDDFGNHIWAPQATRKLRSLDTIYLPAQVKSKLQGGLKKFLGSEALYDRFGITWKRVHLFYGPPGSGKSSTVLALASTFKKHMAKLTITPQGWEGMRCCLTHPPHPGQLPAP